MRASDKVLFLCCKKHSYIAPKKSCKDALEDVFEDAIVFVHIIPKHHQSIMLLVEPCYFGNHEQAAP